MRILYLGYFCPAELFAVLSETDRDLSVAAHKYETQLLNQLAAQCEKRAVEDVNVISILSYTDEGMYRPQYDEYAGMKLDYVWKSRYSMFPSRSELQRMESLVTDWLHNTEGCERIVLTYATNPVLMYPFLIKKRGVKIVTICSEIPQYRIMSGNVVKRFLKKAVARYLNDRMDGYIYFTKYMSEATNPKNKPYIVVEGLPDIRAVSEELSAVERRENIFYAGYLLAENGIDVLLEAFLLLENPDVQLTLCGTGAMVDEIEEYAKKCKRIRYLGQLPNDRVLQLEREATLLINPRKPESLLTRYSFPSKTFEYLTSGTPAIITRLDGIPDEYYDYCYVCDVSSPETLAADLEKVLSIHQSVRSQKAKEALTFVEQEKSSFAQVHKIVSFLKKQAKGESE